MVRRSARRILLVRARQEPFPRRRTPEGEVQDWRGAVQVPEVVTGRVRGHPRLVRMTISPLGCAGVRSPDTSLLRRLAQRSEVL